MNEVQTIGKDIFLEQLAAVYDASGWFTGLKDALNGVTFEQAIWQANESSNSIWGNVRHLAYWSEFFLEKYKPGSVGEIVELENARTFDVLEQEKTEENWKKEVERLERAIEGWRNAMNENPGKLNEEDWTKLIAGYLLHTAYHIGQIVTIRKQQESWTASGL
ncbi:hypothetical protein AM500_14015 [Bacillus sp. FJAT-18017]|uniref:DinB family protein n=1 Tax=Bacillus sp. FJAT-18017 TaxID=1705566 RepID=UPI0006B023EB|nr:DinB family protein [Bacillus sp. FJAT-18017]ALC90778.1 hypothetical protein AM500_14015 [Bacillus sp. FJAT-18017]